MVRLGGRVFSAFTRGMDKSFDARMSDIKHGVTVHLIEQTQGCTGYTQGDEIEATVDLGAFIARTEERRIVYARDGRGLPVGGGLLRDGRPLSRPFSPSRGHLPRGAPRGKYGERRGQP